MAQVTFTKAIESISGAIDSVKQGQISRMRLVVRRHDYGEGRNYDHEGHKIHELYVLSHARRCVERGCDQEPRHA